MENCLACGLKLRGRTDKKFCGDHCRSHYNNTLNKNKDIVLKEINRILRKNAGILEKFNNNGITPLARSMLGTAGFNFNFFTHQLYGPAGEVYNCCYNYGYLMLNEELLLKSCLVISGKIPFRQKKIPIIKW